MKVTLNMNSGNNASQNAIKNARISYGQGNNPMNVTIQMNSNGKKSGRNETNLSISFEGRMMQQIMKSQKTSGTESGTSAAEQAIDVSKMSDQELRDMLAGMKEKLTAEGVDTSEMKDASQLSDDELQKIRDQMTKMKSQMEDMKSRMTSGQEINGAQSITGSGNATQMGGPGGPGGPPPGGPPPGGKPPGGPPPGGPPPGGGAPGGTNGTNATGNSDSTTSTSTAELLKKLLGTEEDEDTSTTDDTVESYAKKTLAELLKAYDPTSVNQTDFIEKAKKQLDEIAAQQKLQIDKANQTVMDQLTAWGGTQTQQNQ